MSNSSFNNNNTNPFSLNNNNSNNKDPFASLNNNISTNISNSLNNNNIFSSINNNNNKSNLNLNNNLFSFNNNIDNISLNSFNIFKNDNNSNNINTSNIFSKNTYEDNSKYIDLGQQMNFSNGQNDDIWNDPFNPKWYADDSLNKKDYDKNDINLLNEKIQNYIESNKGRKNYLEFCDKNSQTLNEIRNFDPNLDYDF